VSDVCRLVAKDSSRSNVLSTVFLKQTVSQFLQVISKGYACAQDANFKDRLRNLALVICDLMANEAFSPKYDEDEELLLLVRRVWFSLILFVLQKDGLWPDNWKSIIILLASKSPALLISKKAKSLDADLASCLEFQLSIPEEVPDF
jgi:hypothetical protein